ncbi:MAG: hypothetical protein B6I19_01010 [Bacteroidetes bacterium 4572_114]|nr:MAG: hypothetical protein B6I19_01010 [Bacteroidetes bacterium 4572_114]
MKKHTIIASLSFLLFSIGFSGNVLSQISYGGVPPTTRFSIENDDFPVFETPVPDVERLLAEDAETGKYGIPMRFAECRPVEINLAKEGNWLNMPDGGKICRLAVSSENAQAILLYYDKFLIPEGGGLFLYNTNKWQVIGAFNHKTNNDGGVFATEMIYGEQVILEYVQPYGLKEKPEIIIGEVGYVYRTAERIFGGRGFGSSGPCEVNVNCLEGNEWQDQKNGSCKIIVKQSGSSSVLCSGTLVNNTRQDGTPYLITADHCGADATPDDLDAWIFYFRYEGPDCEDPSSDTLFDSYTIVGASKVAAAGGAGVASDFKLIKLNVNVPENYNPYFVGWSNIGDASPEGVTIHQPQGDIRKISTYTSTLTSTNWGSIGGTHWKVVWSETENGHGVTEPGSSGCPIFNIDGRMVGQLTGGDASCSNLTGPDYYGKFSYSWDKIGNADSTRLKPWLDPDNTGLDEIDGISIVGINEQKKENPLAVFPNPTTGLVNIDVRAFQGQLLKVEVFNVLGERVYLSEGSIPSSGLVSFDLSKAKTGVYIVKLLVDGEVFSARVLR